MLAAVKAILLDGLLAYLFYNTWVGEQEFAESKAASEGNIQSQGQSQGRQQPSQAGDGFMSIPDGVDDDELPFN